MALHSALSLLKLLIFELLLGIPKMFLRSISAHIVENVLSLNTLHLLILIEGTLTCLQKNVSLDQILQLFKERISSK
jgi:hypothetical protein